MRDLQAAGLIARVQVQNDGVGRACARRFYRAFTVLRNFDVVPPPAQKANQRLRNLGVILD
jgi:hypothetical protein